MGKPGLLVRYHFPCDKIGLTIVRNMTCFDNFYKKNRGNLSRSDGLKDVCLLVMYIMTLVGVAATELSHPVSLCAVWAKFDADI